MINRGRKFDPKFSRHEQKISSPRSESNQKSTKIGLTPFAPSGRKFDPKFSRHEQKISSPRSESNQKSTKIGPTPFNKIFYQSLASGLNNLPEYFKTD
jgi:hypothetical protein